MCARKFYVQYFTVNTYNILLISLFLQFTHNFFVVVCALKSYKKLLTTSNKRYKK